MPRELQNDGGFSVVELVIAMLLLAVVALAILPALWQGIQLSSEQSAVATATRELNSLVERARENPTCGNLAAVAATRTVTDGSGREFDTSGTVGACASSAAVQLELTAVDASGAPLTAMSAVVYIP